MDRTAVKVRTLQDQDEAFCLNLSLDDRIRVQEELNRQGRILAGYPAVCVLNRRDARVLTARRERKTSSSSR